MVVQDEVGRFGVERIAVQEGFERLAGEVHELTYRKEAEFRQYLFRNQREGMDVLDLTRVTLTSCTPAAALTYSGRSVLPSASSPDSLESLLKALRPIRFAKLLTAICPTLRGGHGASGQDMSESWASARRLLRRRQKTQGRTYLCLVRGCEKLPSP